MAERMQQTMPEPGWVSVDAGKHLDVLFHKNRRQGVRVDDIVRPSIIVGVPGKKHQVIRLDPFSVEGHYHVLPTQHDTPIPFLPVEGQTCLETALGFFDAPDRFRALLVRAHDAQVAREVTDEELMGVARQIREICRT